VNGGGEDIGGSVGGASADLSAEGGGGKVQPKRKGWREREQERAPGCQLCASCANRASCAAALRQAAPGEGSGGEGFSPTIPHGGGGGGGGGGWLCRRRLTIRCA